MSEYSGLFNPHLFLPKLTSALRFDDMDSDATLNLFTYALDPQRNYAELNQRIDSFANRADIIFFQRADRIDLAKMLIDLPKMSVFQQGPLAIAVRESETRRFALSGGYPGVAQTGTLYVRGYKPLALMNVSENGPGILAWVRGQTNPVAVGGLLSTPVAGLQGGILEGDARWYVSKEIMLERRWLGALTASGTRPVAIKVKLPSTREAEPSPVPQPTPHEPPKYNTPESETMLILTSNNHGTHGTNQAWFQQIRDLKPHIILGQEFHGGAFGDAANALGSLYHIAPGMAFRIGREATATPVFMLKARFDILGQGNPQISPWRGGGEHGRLWPTRYGTWMRAKDRISGRTVNARSVHTWAVGPNAPEDIKVGHRRQISAVADWSRQNPRDITVAGGDWNEELRNKDTWANIRMAQAGMHRCGTNDGTGVEHGARLDDLFLKSSNHTEVISASVLRHNGGSDHSMTATRIRSKRV